MKNFTVKIFIGFFVESTQFRNDEMMKSVYMHNATQHTSTASTVPGESQQAAGSEADSKQSVSPSQLHNNKHTFSTYISVDISDLLHNTMKLAILGATGQTGDIRPACRSEISVQAWLFGPRAGGCEAGPGGGTHRHRPGAEPQQARGDCPPQPHRGGG